MRFMACLAATWVCAAGCQRTLMPTPVVFQGGEVDPFEEVRPADRATTLDLYIATNRKPSQTRPAQGNPKWYFTDDLSRVLRLATVSVRLGDPPMDWTQLCEQSRRAKRSPNPVVRVEGMSEIGVLYTTAPPRRDLPDPTGTADDREPAERFAREVNERLARSSDKDIYIFIHGFNTGFDQDLAFAAALWHFLGRQGVFIQFAWPSKHSLFAYEKDKLMADNSIRNFRLLLQFLAQHTDVERINILAHSAGAPIAVHALTDLRFIHFDDDPETVRSALKIGQVILAAPDIDVMKFMDAMRDGFGEATEQTTFYMSSTDTALSFSRMIWGMARLGSPIDALDTDDIAALGDSPYINAVDVALAQSKHGGGIGHGYFHTDIWVSADIILTLRFGLPPDRRGLILADDDALWDFPEDYVDRVTEIGRQLYGGE